MPAGHVAGLEGKGLNYNQHRKNKFEERGRVLSENSHSSNAQIPRYNGKIIPITFS